MANRKLARARNAMRTGKLGHSRLARAIALGILLGGVAPLAVPAQAADSTWTGTTSDDWSETTNWVVPPVSGSFVLIDALAPHDAHLRGAAQVGATIVGDQAQGQLVIEAGGNLEVFGTQPAADPYGTPLGLVIANARDSQGTVRVTGAGARLAAVENTLVGNGGTGNLEILDGGTAELGLDSMYAETVVGFGYYAWGDSREGVGHVVVDGAGSTLTHAGGLNVLNGTVDISNGGQLASVVRPGDYPFWVDVIGMGLPASADGSIAELVGQSTATVSGAGSAWNSINGLSLGDGGNGTLVVRDGGAANFQGYVALGQQATLFAPDGSPTGLKRAGNGNLLVSGAGSSLTLVANPDGGPGDLVIGDKGASSARIESGGSASIAGTVTVGDGADGTLDIASGGSMTVASSDANGTGLMIGAAEGASGTVTVSGAGSTLTIAAGAQVGSVGTGSLSVLDGGHASIGAAWNYSETLVGFGYYGWDAGAEHGSGSITVDGAGSLLDYAGGLNVLNGAISVGNGGQLVGHARSDAFWIDMLGWGVPADTTVENGFAGLPGVATANVSGEGSAWNSANALSVGEGGQGSLQVTGGADASFGAYARLGTISYLYDAPAGSPRLEVPPATGLGSLLVSGAGSSFAIKAAEGAESWKHGDLFLGYSAGSSGDMVVADGASASADGVLEVGRGGAGSLLVDGGATLSVGGVDANSIGMIIGGGAGSTGNVTVSGAGSALTVAAGAQVGSSGHGSLQVTGGGTADIGLDTDWAEIVVGFGYYGMGAGAEQGRGDILVSGTGSTLDYAGGMNVLNGSLTVSDGGQLVNHLRADVPWWVDDVGMGQVADPARGTIELDGSGNVLVSGEGSAWISHNQLEIGSGGYGFVGVSDGADASFKSNVEIGVASRGAPGVATKPGSGTLVVDGEGSTFAVDAVVVDGQSGPGTLGIGRKGGYGYVQASNGGTISAEGGIQVGTMGTLAIGGWAEDESALAAGSIDAPTLQLEGDGSLVLHHSGNAVFGAAISGDGWISASSGYSTLTGDSSAFAGSTLIDGGATLAISGKLGGAMPYVGQDGAGTLLVDGGGDVHVTGSADFGNGLILGLHDGSSGTATVTGAGSTLSVDAGVQIGNAGAGALSVLAGGTANLGLQTAYAETILGLGYYGWSAESGEGTGTLRVDGAGSTVNYGGGLNVLDGTVSVTGGGQLLGVARPSEAGWIDMIGWGVPADPDPTHDFAGLRGTSAVTVSGEGSAWKSLNGLDIGDGGDGALSVLDGGDASFQGNVYVGGQSYLYDALGGSPVPGLAPQTGTGTIRVSGAGTSLAVGPGIASKGWIDVGYRAKGSMEVSDGATASVAYTLYLGDYSDGTLSVTGGATMSVLGANPLGGGNLLGVNQGGTGTILVSGAGSKLSFAGGLQVGNAGTGIVSVLGGATVNAGLDIAYAETLVGAGNYGWATGAETGKGTITVDGAGSSFNYAGGLNVLNGAVVVSGGGKVASHGRAADGTAFWTDTIGFGLPANPDGSYAGLHGVGAVTLTGAGSAWTSLNGLNIGYGDAGSLSVLGGAHAGFAGYAELGKLSYLFDAPDGGPVPGLAGIPGAGTLLVSGAGSSFVLSALDGNTTWGAGALELGSEAAGSVVVNNGGTLSAAGGIKVGAQGTFTVGGMQGGTLAAPGTVTSGITLMAPAATLVFNHSATAHDDTAYAFAPVISGNGHVDVAGGFTRLTGDSSAFTGDTTIDTGATLSVNGSLGGDISVDGRLQGTGTVGNVTVNNGGTLAPGNSPGTLHVDGDLLMQAGSIYSAEIDSDTGASDSIAVAGNVQIESGTVLSISNLGTAPLTPGASIELIQTVGTTSTVEGQFDTVVGGSELLDFGVSYEGGQIQVAAERSETTNFASVAGAGLGGLGTALDGIPDDSALTRLLFTQVTTAAAAQALVDDMAGTIHADLRRVMLEDSRYPRAALGDRLQDDDASGGVAWVRAMGGSATTEGAGALPGATVDHSGIMVGYDTAVGASRLGIAIGSDKGSYTTDGKSASADLYDRHLSLYGRSLLGGLRVGYGVAFGSTDAKATRSFDIGSAPQQLHSKHEARTTQGFVDIGYRLGGGNSFRYLEPFLNVARVQVRDDATTEEGGVAALEIASGDTSATFGTVGLRWSADMGGADFAGSIGWRHAFGFDVASTSQAFVAGGPAFTIDSLPVDNAVMLDLGARFRMSDHARVWLGYNGMMAGSAHDHGLKLQFNLDL
jgi:outer membrane autotransporter protein